METKEQVQAQETVKMGPDVVTIEGDRVTIDAKHAMPEWQVREFSPTPIYFRDKKYFLCRKAPATKPFAIRYFLDPWREGTPAGKVSFNYDEEAIAQREAEIRGGHVDDVGRAGLIFLYPFLGLLWSGSKERLRRFGFDSRSITGISIFMVFGLVLLDLVFAKTLIFRSLKAGDVVIGGMLRAFSGVDALHFGSVVIPMLWLDILLLALLFADMLIRYSHHLGGEEPCWGFCEWVKCLVPRKKNQQPVVAEAPPIIARPAAPASEPVAPIRMSNR
ncbi:MAG TPA: hypothetical protein VJ063_08120 [Verrucomicrobiae bacterium]|nr:hypothetical protein [Verrucomicrobiae bacterium]